MVQPTLDRSIELRLASATPRRPARWGSAFLQQNLASIGGEIVLVALIIVGIIGPFVAPYDPLKVQMTQRLHPPSAEHWMGTDELGRDIWSRMLHGSRATLSTVVFVLAIVMVFGIPIGAIGGYVGGWTDEVFMRVSDLILAFPPLVLAMALVVALKPSLTTAMLAVALVRWPRYARLVRAQVLTFKQRAFVEAARAVGVSERRILLRQILPNCLDPVYVRATVDAGFIVLTTASLSFIGLGAQPPQPEWGAMVASGRTYMINNWWVGVFPGLAIMLAVTGFVLVGDEIRDRLDPTLRR
ncbi:MAG: ABC transporter permease [Ardenticatenaceae bacterium]|nr:ABC transporter permease [Ardenticatenaceae bacterium]HBY94160.1 D,D-dipeptide ABC transporter permease [Chloroflexota bacterium]